MVSVLYLAECPVCPRVFSVPLPDRPLLPGPWPPCASQRAGWGGAVKPYFREASWWSPGDLWGVKSLSGAQEPKTLGAARGAQVWAGEERVSWLAVPLLSLSGPRSGWIWSTVGSV